MKPVRMGVLGAANIARQTVIPAMHEAEGVICVAIASRRPGAAVRFAQEMAIPLAFDSYEALLASAEVDAVYIPVANGEHQLWTERAAIAGKHILCEKPLGLDRAEAEAMFRVAEQHGVRLLEAYSYYFHPQHHRVLAIAASGEIGRPSVIRCRFNFPFYPPKAGPRLNVRLDPVAGGAGALMDIGCYGIHTALRVMGTSPIAVVAHALNSDRGVDVATSITLEFPDDRLAMIDVNFTTFTTREYDVLGPLGSIRLPKGYGNFPAGTEYPIVVTTQDGERIETLPYANQATLMVEHFGQVVQDPTTKLFTTQSETLAIMQILDAAAQSMRTGQRIQVS